MQKLANHVETSHDTIAEYEDAAHETSSENLTHSETPTGSSHDLPRHLGDPDDFRVIRDAERDLAFTGWRTGSARDGTGGQYPHDWTRQVAVDIYSTDTGHLVTAVERTTRWVGEHPTHWAAVHTEESEAFTWLMEKLQTVRQEQERLEQEDPHRTARHRMIHDQGRAMGAAIKEAWEEACGRCPSLAGADVERV